MAFDIQRVVEFDFLRATEIAALNCMQWIGKGNKDRILPLHPLIRDIVADFPTGYWFPGRAGNTIGHIHARSVSDLMRLAKNRAGVVGARLTGHSLRHFYGTELVKAGVDLRTVQELMRHENLNTTQLYVAVADDRLVAALARLPTVSIPAQSGRTAA